jgi:hypothetical protein
MARDSSLTFGMTATHSLTHSLTYSLTHLLTYSLTHLLTYSLSYSLTQLLGHSVTWSLGHLVTWLLVSYVSNLMFIMECVHQYTFLFLRLTKLLYFRLKLRHVLAYNISHFLVRLNFQYQILPHYLQ